MIEQGTVIKLEGDCARVAFVRHERCDRCKSCRLSSDGTHVVAKIKNTLNANVGDRVNVNMRELSLTLSALIYLVPLALVAFGAILGSLMSKIAAAILSAAGLAIGLAIALPIDVLVFRRKLRPKMTEFVSVAEET